MSEARLFLTHRFLFSQRCLFLMGGWEGRDNETISAMSAASSLSDAQIKSLLIPYVVASQRLGLFYHQRIILGAQYAFRDPPFPAHWPCCHTLPLPEISKMTHTGRQWQVELRVQHNTMPAGSVFCWLPMAQATQNINRAFEIIVGQSAIGRHLTHVNLFV